MIMQATGAQFAPFRDQAIDVLIKAIEVLKPPETEKEKESTRNKSERKQVRNRKRKKRNEGAWITR